MELVKRLNWQLLINRTLTLHLPIYLLYMDKNLSGVGVSGTPPTFQIPQTSDSVIARRTPPAARF
jgi:hypothetical protein